MADNNDFNNVTLVALAAMAFAVYSYRVGETHYACATEPMRYSEVLQESIHFWKVAGQKDVTITWNPKAPGFATLRMNVLIDATDDKLIIYSGPEERDRSFVAHLGNEGVMIADGHLHTVSMFGAFDPRDGGATTGMPAELLALRLLVLTNSVPVVAAFDLKQPRRLSKDDERKLAQAIYPDSPALTDGAGKPPTFLRSSTDGGVTTYEWMDDAGAIVRIETKSLNEAVLRNRKQEFQWLKKRYERLTMPHMSQLIAHLLEANAITAREGKAIAFGKGGARSSDALDDREGVVMEMMRFRVAEQVGVISVSQAAPLGVHAARDLKDTHGDVIGRVAAIADVGDAIALSLTGQDWIITVNVPGLGAGSDSANRVVEEVETWLRTIRVKP